MLEGFGSKCCMSFQGFTNSASVQKAHCGFTVFFPNMEVKTNLTYLCFLSMATIEIKVS